MWKSFYAALDFAWLPVAATLFFVVFFCGVLLYVARKKDFSSAAALPLLAEGESRAASPTRNTDEETRS
jgi:hypothetical protein